MWPLLEISVDVIAREYEILPASTSGCVWRESESPHLTVGTPALVAERRRTRRRLGTLGMGFDGTEEQREEGGGHV